MNRNAIKKNSWSDLSGIITAFICLVHCMATPFILALQTQLIAKYGGYWSSLNFLFLAIGLSALIHSLKIGRRKYIKLLLCSFYLALAIGLIAETRYPVLEYVNYLSASGLMFTHFINHRHCKRCGV